MQSSRIKKNSGRSGIDIERIEHGSPDAISIDTGSPFPCWVWASVVFPSDYYADPGGFADSAS